MKKRESILHIIWKLTFQSRVIIKPSTKLRLRVVYIVINLISPVLKESSNASRKDIAITIKSLGLSCLLVTLKSDVIPKTLKRTIVRRGITTVSNTKRNSYPKERLIFRVIDIIAKRINERVTTLEKNFANLFLMLSFFILFNIMSIPDIRKRAESKSEVSNIRKYSLSILNVFISNLIREYEIKYIPVMNPSVLNLFLIEINITKVRRLSTDSYRNTGWKWV